jgi:parallel beta-helix repeat protein
MVKGFIDTPVYKPLEATIFIAASDARPEVKALADYVCTGVNDDVVISQAISMLPASGGRIRLSEGNFVFGNTLVISRNNVSLEGSGPGTVIKGAISSDYIQVAPYHQYIKISNLKIDGSSQTSGNGIYLNGTADNPISRCIVSDCWIYNVYEGGIRLIYSYYTIVSNNIVESPRHGYAIGIWYGGNNTIIGNTCLAGGLNAIDNDTSNYSTIIGNVCIGNSGGGIWISSSSNVVVSGNIMFHNSGNADVYIINSGLTNIISSNVMQSLDTTYSIGEVSGDYNIFTNNQCVSGKISITGPHSIVANNIQTYFA